MGLEEFGIILRRHRRIAIDTTVFICHLESNAKYLPLTEQVFSRIESHGVSGVTSTITMTELLIQPYRSLDERRVDEMYALLTTFPNLSWIAPNLDIADLAARIRAFHNLRTPDALQAATALREEATALITNDLAFERVSELNVIILDRFV